MQVKQVDIKKLKFSEYNPRQATEKEFSDLKNSIQEFGMVDPVIVNSAPKRKGVIIGGHFRVRVCRSLKMKTIPVVYVSIPDLKREQALNLRLNRNLGKGDWDLLANNFDIDFLKGIGFTPFELGDMGFEDEIDKFKNLLGEKIAPDQDKYNWVWVQFKNKKDMDLAIKLLSNGKSRELDSIKFMKMLNKS